METAGTLGSGWNPLLEDIALDFVRRECPLAAGRRQRATWPSEPSIAGHSSTPRARRRRQDGSGAEKAHPPAHRRRDKRTHREPNRRDTQTLRRLHRAPARRGRRARGDKTLGLRPTRAHRTQAPDASPVHEKSHHWIRRRARLYASEIPRRRRIRIKKTPRLPKKTGEDIQGVRPE